MSKMSSNYTGELVFVPTPGMGHLLSTVELAKRIITRYPNISITIHIINLHLHAAKITAYVDSNSRDNPYPTRLTFITLPPLSNPPDITSPNFFSTTITLHKPLVKQAVVDRTRSGFPKPIGFILDMFCVTMIDVANDINVPSYIFFTSGANLLNLMYHTLSLDEQGIDTPAKFSEPGFSTVVPGIKNPVTSKIIPGTFQDRNRGAEKALNMTRRFRATKGILMNTYVELESYGLESLLDSPDKTVPPVYAVGPILELDNKNRESGSHEGKKEDSIVQWLDGQPESSVVFLCFGSMGSFDEDQVKEIANGLDQSGQRFLWALRKPPPKGKMEPPSENGTFEEALPEGFLDRTADRGKIIGWAPQVEVLAHPAVGGFVSHCGWNSTLESLWFGVPIATFPLYAEQQLNAFTLVKELGLAVEIRMDYRKDFKACEGNFLVTAEEIKNGVKKLMSMDHEMRSKVKELSNVGRKALDDGGSSSKFLERFIVDVFSNVA